MLKRTMMLMGRLQNRHATARTSWQVTVPCNWALSISCAWMLSSGPGRHHGRKDMTSHLVNQSPLAQTWLNVSGETKDSRAG